MTLLRRIFGGASRGDATRDTPRDIPEIAQRARDFAASGDYDEALRTIRPTVDTAIDDPRLWHAVGEVLALNGRLREARDALAKAVAGGDPDALYDFARACMATGDLDAAESSLRRAIDAAPGRSEYHRELGDLLHRKGRPDDAIRELERSIALAPASAAARLALASVMLDRGDAAAAERHARSAVALDPDDSAAWAYVGAALSRQDRHADALAALERATGLEASRPSGMDVFVNLAIALGDVGRAKDALDVLESRLPRHPAALGYHAYSMALLASGRMAEGWRYYEFRWLVEPLLSKRPSLRVPRWEGQDVRGKTVLVLAEQGIGDFVQFVRYVPLVKARGATVLLLATSACARLARGVAGVDRVVSPGEEIVAPDFHVHLMSLPGVLGGGLDDIPADVPYLRTDADRVAHWGARLGPREGLRVGVAWSGNPNHANDRARSIALSRLRDIASVEGVRFYSLQKGHGEAQAEGDAGSWLTDRLGPDMDDLADAAAVIAQLDLVVCVDTALAHLAGALGTPVWVLVAIPSDFRWLRDREDSPWYPTMRLFRQRLRGQWDDVIARVRREIEAMRDGARGSPRDDAPALPVPSPAAPSGMCEVSESRRGILQYLPADGDIGRSLASYGEWLEGLRAVVSPWVRPGATALEVGAGVGYTAMWLASAVGVSGHVILFEPNDLKRRILQQNLAANRVGNVTMLRSLATIDGLQLGALSWLECSDASRSDDVISGAESTLWRLRPGILLAAFDHGQQRDLGTRLQGLGYRCWRVGVPMHRLDNFNRRTDDVFDGSLAFAVLALPEEAEAPDEASGLEEMGSGIPS